MTITRIRTMFFLAVRPDPVEKPGVDFAAGRGVPANTLILGGELKAFLVEQRQTGIDSLSVVEHLSVLREVFQGMM